MADVFATNCADLYLALKDVHRDITSNTAASILEKARDKASLKPPYAAANFVAKVQFVAFTKDNAGTQLGCEEVLGILHQKMVQHHGKWLFLGCDQKIFEYLRGVIKGNMNK